MFEEFSGSTKKIARECFSGIGSFIWTTTIIGLEHIRNIMMPICGFQGLDSQSPIVNYWKKEASSINLDWQRSHGKSFLSTVKKAYLIINPSSLIKKVNNWLLCCGAKIQCFIIGRMKI